MVVVGGVVWAVGAFGGRLVSGALVKTMFFSAGAARGVAIPCAFVRRAGAGPARKRLRRRTVAWIHSRPATGSVALWLAASPGVEHPDTLASETGRASGGPIDADFGVSSLDSEAPGISVSNICLIKLPSRRESASSCLSAYGICS